MATRELYVSRRAFRRECGLVLPLRPSDYATGLYGPAVENGLPLVAE